METYATVKGQIVIPVKLRRKYGIKEGTKIIVMDAGDEIVLRPITEQYLKKLRGSLKDTDALNVLMDERKQDKAKGK
jgi:AbrB family looped-hinge helix DNA binding protein